MTSISHGRYSDTAIATTILREMHFIGVECLRAGTAQTVDCAGESMDDFFHAIKAYMALVLPVMADFELHGARKATLKQFPAYVSRMVKWTPTRFFRIRALRTEIELMERKILDKFLGSIIWHTDQQHDAARLLVEEAMFIQKRTHDDDALAAFTTPSTPTEIIDLLADHLLLTTETLAEIGKQRA